MTNKVVPHHSLNGQIQPVEEFFKIILLDKKILPTIMENDPNFVMKLEETYTPSELEIKLNSLIESIKITYLIANDFPTKIILESITKSKEEFQYVEIDKKNRIFQSGYSIKEIPPSPLEHLNLNNPSHWGMESCFEFCEIKYNALSKLEEIILSTTKKLKTKLSVGDLSLLFRLLKEEGLLDIKNNTELYRFISSNFSTKSTEIISEKSIKNKFLSPDNTSIKNLDILLVNLRQHLKKM